jgi:hypothetical protein
MDIDCASTWPIHVSTMESVSGGTAAMAELSTGMVPTVPGHQQAIMNPVRYPTVTASAEPGSS